MMAKTEKKPATLRADHYDVILSPHVTEKTTNGSEHRQVTFKVALNANKTVIKEAVEALFKVSVTGVNTVRIKGKKKLFRGRPGQRSDYKKAVVTLAEGQMIDMQAGV
jgi:large subunit ribosomal protein L23